MPEYPDGPELVASIPQVDKAELVQKGGQKAVYKARMEGQIVAVKVIPLESDDAISKEADADAIEEVTTEADADMNSAIERAKREVDILDQVDVPVLAKRGPSGLLTFQVRDARWLCFTEEWIEGRTLQAMIGGGRFTPDRIVRLGIDLIQATCWLSSRELVHRDIKPANVMWAEDRSRFVLIDAGIALDRHGPSLTQFPAVVGTMAYLSPEQTDPSRKRSLDFRSDLFAIGIVLYEAAVGKHPFIEIGTTPLQVLASILKKAPKPVAEVVADFPSTLSAFISRLLNKVPHLRFRTCDRAHKAIEGIATELGVEI